MYACMYVYVCMCMYVCMYVCMYESATVPQPSNFPPNKHNPQMRELHCSIMYISWMMMMMMIECELIRLCGVGWLSIVHNCTLLRFVLVVPFFSLFFVSFFSFTLVPSASS